MYSSSDVKMPSLGSSITVSDKLFFLLLLSDKSFLSLSFMLLTSWLAIWICPD